MGDYDVPGVVSGIEIDAPYIGLVASDRRAAEVIDRAADQLGIDPESVQTAVTNSTRPPTSTSRLYDCD